MTSSDPEISRLRRVNATSPLCSTPWPCAKGRTLEAPPARVADVSPGNACHPSPRDRRAGCRRAHPATFRRRPEEPVTVDLVELVINLETFILTFFVGLALPVDPMHAMGDICRRMTHVNEMASLPWSRRTEPADTVNDAKRLRRDLEEFADIYVMDAIDKAMHRDRSKPPETMIETIVDGFDPHRMDGELIAREAWTYMAAGVQTSAFAVLDAVPHLLDWFAGT